MEYEPLRYPSWCLCRLLENISGIGTEDEVALRRKLWGTINYLHDVDQNNTKLSSGSKVEGFNFESSDFDGMVIDRICNGTNDLNIRESLVEYDNSAVVSSVLYRDQYKYPEYGLEGHGPCNTLKGERDIDIAYCFECKWPSAADELIHRPRPYGWPSKCLLDKILSESCHIVPIGVKDHNLSYIQWRLSFSSAEKALIHSFNHTQFLVYGLMKIFLKQVINKVKSVKDLLCSYFLKTALFYSIESTSQSFWREDLIIPCFWFCFNRLIKWVECGYCPNFFVPENNMFRGKVFKENQHKLLTVLKQIKSIGWNCICLCDDLRSFQYVLHHQESVLCIGLIPSKAEFERRLDQTILSMLVQNIAFRSVSQMRSTLSRSIISLSYCRSQQERDINTLNLIVVLRSVGRFHFCSDVSQNNKARYRSVRKCKIMLQKTADRDVSVGPLILATYYYTTGQYNKAVQMCHRVISQWKPFVLCIPIAPKQVIDLYEQHICGRGVSVVDKVKTACTGEVLIDSIYKDFYPTEMRYDIEAASPFHTEIPPLPYIEFILCLCHMKLGNIDSSLAALRDLQILIHDETQGYRRCPMVLNLLAICLEKLGYVDRAIDMYLLSQEIKPQRNGACKLLEKLLRRTQQ